MGSLFLSPGNLLEPGMEPRFPELQADSLPSEPPENQRVVFARNWGGGEEERGFTSKRLLSFSFTG